MLDGTEEEGDVGCKIASRAADLLIQGLPYVHLAKISLKINGF